MSKVLRVLGGVGISIASIIPGVFSYLFIKLAIGGWSVYQIDKVDPISSNLDLIMVAVFCFVAGVLGVLAIGTFFYGIGKALGLLEEDKPEGKEENVITTN